MKQSGSVHRSETETRETEKKEEIWIWSNLQLQEPAYEIQETEENVKHHRKDAVRKIQSWKTTEQVNRFLQKLKGKKREKWRETLYIVRNFKDIIK